MLFNRETDYALRVIKNLHTDIPTSISSLAEGEFCQLKVNRSLKNSKVLSADVTVGFDPDFQQLFYILH